MPKHRATGIKGFFRHLVYYHTNKVVQIRSFKLGILYNFLLLLVLAYVCLWMIWWRKGYQSADQLIGLTAVKVKGVSYLNVTGGIQVWDAEDVVRPAKESEALFLTTNFLETPKQQRSSQCPSRFSCNATNPCTKGFLVDTVGIMSGECVNSKCLMNAWCPPEPRNDTGITNYLNGVDQFTVLIRQTVKSTKWQYTTSNFVKDTVKEGKGQNVFTVKEMTGNAFAKYQQAGAIFAVIVNWDIDLDQKGAQYLPTFEFVPIADGEEDKGYNYRYANYYYLNRNGTEGEEPVETRDLFKVFGLRFIFLLGGQARKFDPIPLIITIGSGLAFLSVAAILADLITLYILPERRFYNNVKYERVESLERRKLASNGLPTETTPLVGNSSSVSLREMEEGGLDIQQSERDNIPVTLDTVKFK